MKVGNLIRCSDPPHPLSNETLGVIISCDGLTVTVKWPSNNIKIHDRKDVMWVEEGLNKKGVHSTVS